MGVAELDGAKTLLEQYRLKQEPPGTTHEEVWRAKVIYESAFHPQTGEKNFFLGRMSCQVPANMIITGAMMTWYKSNTATILLQWANQTFNATANYTNRNASSKITNEMLAQAYVAATVLSVSVAVGLNKMIARSPTLSKGMIGRFVPLTAIAAANCINIPMMRQVELKEGITVSTADGVEVGKSKAAALGAVSQASAALHARRQQHCDGAFAQTCRPQARCSHISDR
jgi:tricarboxylate carrier